MSASAAEHLARGAAGHHPGLPETTSGTIRLDLGESGRTEHWYLTIDRQEVEVSRSAEAADLVIRADREVFDRIATGRLHLAAAILRNDISGQGNLRLLTMLRRIFPGPPGARHPRDVVASPHRLAAR
ncbi:SCP2 sterol-binding domain-containing protein [Micromonospora sp. WMMD998]|uniref:SCP2 sterol-binding domain-containing protein n=1 Tax=Micromonospora sp. WMMD998 TaxID=3016092 RepID=UPI00249CB6BA|nr:SCP2 sterol-binding domain-containing protein [Micromonospora sp. WMMD998]WFE39427.1 SCP2 sterol-binding domain-containing protein [Micromonospora sp. WMMD998]